MSEFEVRLTDSRSSRMLTRYIPRDSLSFRSVDPGGFGSVSFDLARDLNAADFEEFSEVAVFDAENGEQVGGGRLLNPGRNLDTSGELWKVAALGEGPAHLGERREPYFLIDTSLDRWHSGSSTSQKRTWAPGEAPDGPAFDTSGILFQISQTSTGVGAYTNLDYYDLNQFQQEIGGYKFQHIEGTGSSNSRLESQIRPIGGPVFDVSDQPWSTSERTITKQVTTDWNAVTQASRRMNLVFVRQSSTLTVTDADWILVWNPRVSAIRKDRTGADIVTAGAYSQDYVLGADAIVDCWARFCPRLDLINARIDATTFQHNQLVWGDGASPFEVMQSLMDAEPGYTWAVWEKQDNGKFRAEWRTLDTAVRYELTVDDGFEETGAGSDRYVSVFSVGQNLRSRYHVEHATSYSDNDLRMLALGFNPSDTIGVSAAGDGYVLNTLKLAQATSHLEGSKLRASAAQATVARRVYDHFTGRWVQPWKVLPGYLARVSGVRARVGTLNDGATPESVTFRVVSNDYSVAAGASQLELNSYTVDEARALAQLVSA